MPHQCTNCNRIFADGSKEMLSGCPDCGGNKFQFRPKGSVDADAGAPDETPAQSPDSDSGGRGLAGRIADSGAAVRDKVSRGERTTPSGTDTGTRDADTAPATTATETASEPTTDSTPGTPSPQARSAESDDGDIVVADDDPGVGSEGPEDRAQASARSDVVTPEELERERVKGGDERPSDAAGTVIEPSGRDRPSLDELREELNDQFESIKVINPGQYELNLMELYDRDEYIISLQEDGRYVIEVPDAWRSDDRD